MKLYKITLLAGLLSLTLGLAGCNSGSDYDFNASVDTAQDDFDSNNVTPPVALFNPADGIIPSATNLLFSGTVDGTLNIPIDPLESDGAQALKATLNELDGFSTSSPITTSFSTTMDAASVIPGSVRLFQVTTTPEGAVTGVVRELTFPGDYLATLVGVNQDTLVILPLRPLQESTSYLAVLTNGLTDSAGVPAVQDTIYTTLHSTQPLTGLLAPLEGLRLLTATYEAAAATQGIDPADIVLSWVFTTQSITPVLADVASTASAGNLVTAPSGLNTASVGLFGKADIYIGTLDVPYYLTAPSVDNPIAPLTEHWTGVGGSFLTRFNTTPVATSTQTIPVLMTVPNANSAAGATPPAAGWPVVIFNHGITSRRTAMLAAADTLADAGFAVIAIDMPLHGITDATSPLNAANTPFPSDVERTFNVDYVNNDTGAPGPDGVTDPSGQHFINLQHLLTSRDNLRQTVSDLLVLERSLSSQPLLDASNVQFIGHSLGGITGTVFLALDLDVQAATLAMPGGGIARLLDGSASYGPVIEAGLAANGVIKGTADYDTFMVVAQTAVDSGDPINFGAQAASQHPIHLMEVIGGSTSLPDQVIPNSVPGAPLSGTEPLAAVMGLTSLDTSTVDAAGIRGIVRFTAGDHSSVLSPSAGLNVTTEMQSEFASFLFSAGAAINIGAFDPTIIAPAP